MLNYIWLALIIIGILSAAGRDIYDEVENTYRNGVPLTIRVKIDESLKHGEKIQLRAAITQNDYRNHFGIQAQEKNARDFITLPISITVRDSLSGVIAITLDESAPEILSTISNAQGGKNILMGSFSIGSIDSAGTAQLLVKFEPVHFIFLKKITTAAFDAATAAVQIAIGLIGIMALWLGVMKIAEEAGLITIIARIVKPITIRLFPDVPHDHPAIGSIMMNVAANMLGLGNAATPFGLKAMDELNKLNPHAGHATNAMVTFLAMNTSCITLIPATAIAVRATLGSANPAIIIGPTLLASLTATIIGVITAKLLQRLPVFKIPDARES